LLLEGMWTEIALLNDVEFHAQNNVVVGNLVMLTPRRRILSVLSFILCVYFVGASCPLMILLKMMFHPQQANEQIGWNCGEILCPALMKLVNYDAAPILSGPASRLKLGKKACQIQALGRRSVRSYGTRYNVFH
jgi:hypothetical protein